MQLGFTWRDLAPFFFDYFLIFCLPSRGEVMEDKYSGISTNFASFFSGKEFEA